MKEIRFYFSEQNFTKHVVANEIAEEAFENISTIWETDEFYEIGKDEHNPNEIIINFRNIWFIAMVDVGDAKDSNNS